jgi:hypothetical protein
MTPRQLQSLRKRKLEAMQREELLVGLICSASVNYSFCHPEKPVPPTYWMLHPPPPEKLKPLTGDDILAMVHGLPKQFVMRHGEA